MDYKKVEHFWHTIKSFFLCLYVSKYVFCHPNVQQSLVFLAIKVLGILGYLEKYHLQQQYSLLLNRYKTPYCLLILRRK